MKQIRTQQKMGLLQWIKAQKFVIFGCMYLIFNIYILFEMFIKGIDIHSGAYQPLPIPDMTSPFLWLFCAPISFIIYFFYTLGLKVNPKPAKFLLIVPGILSVFTWIFFLIFQQSQFQLLGIYFIIQSIIGGITFIYFKLPEK